MPLEIGQRWMLYLNWIVKWQVNEFYIGMFEFEMTTGEFYRSKSDRVPWETKWKIEKKQNKTYTQKFLDNSN